jgi:hypothetical protein
LALRSSSDTRLDAPGIPMTAMDGGAVFLRSGASGALMGERLGIADGLVKNESDSGDSREAYGGGLYWRSSASGENARLSPS